MADTGDRHVDPMHEYIPVSNWIAYYVLMCR